MKKKLSLLMISFLGLVGFVFAAAFEPTNATETIELTKANIQAQDYLAVTTDNWQTNKTYGGITGDFYNMSSVGRNLTINVKGVSKFEVFVQNSTAGRTYGVTVGSGTEQIITHNGGGVESSGEIVTGTSDEVTITLAGKGSSVYPVKIVLTKAESGSGEGGGEPAEFQDFEITNAQMSGEFDASTLPAGVTFSGTQRNDSHGYGAVTLKVPVTGSVKFTFGGCQYANQTFTVKNEAGETLETLDPHTEKCYHQDGSTITYEYKGEATTLTFATIQYLPYFKAEAIPEEPAEFQDFEITNAQMSGTFDASTLPAGVTFSGTQRNDSHGYGAVTLKVPVTGSVKFTFGGCQYANQTFTVKNEAGETLETLDPHTEKCYHQDGSTITYEYKGEATTLTFATIQYLPYFKAEAIKKVTLVEKSIYKTDFSEWDTFAASATDPVTVKKNTKFTEEELNFSVFNTALMSTDDSKFSNYTTLPHNTLRAEKAANPYIITSALGNITKVRYIHGATGSNRGWKLEAKGDGDEDWVVINSDYANPNAWCEVTKDINKTNCQLRFTNLNSSQNAYLFELEIFGQVDLSGAPLLGTFKANSTTYVADDIFEMGNSGNYEATIELPRSETMISESNPLTDIYADNGDISATTYATTGEGLQQQTVATITVKAEDKSVNYVTTFVYKPDVTLTFFDCAGEKIGTQAVEKDAPLSAFQYDIADVSSTKDGYKARGWFKQNYAGEKILLGDVVAEDMNLYAVETEIEVASMSRKYEFNLADKFFYAEDHEAFSPQEGAQCKFHDTTHGWAVYNGDKIDLLVGPKAIISIATCKYGHMTNILVKKGDETLETLTGMDADTDGKVVTYNYEGEAGTLTLEMVATGESYIHSVKIANISESNYTQDGQWYFVKAGDVSSFLDALEVVNGASGTDRVYLYIPNGTYDLGTAVQTAISRDNVSLIGESRDGVIIKNAPPASVEGLMSASTIHNTGNNLYMQDLTLQNDLDYYGAGAAGRANAFHDGGNNTIAKNVKLMSYQDTYLSTANKVGYWEDSEIHGAVDYICGGGDIFFEKCKLVNESRKKDEKNGEATITAHQPQTAEKFGYVFNNCTVENLASKFNFGRAWGGATGATVRPTVTYLNTTLNQPEEIIASRFTTVGMNNQAGVFHEYNSVDANGTVVSPTTNTQTFTASKSDDALTYETILTAEEAANYSIDKVFTDWTPASYTTQFDAPTDAELKDGTITWTAVTGATGYAIYEDGELLAIVTEGTSYVIESNDTEAAARRAEGDAPVYTIRVANAMGGFGPAATVTNATGIQKVKVDDLTGKVVYDLQGRRVENANHGVFIVDGRKVVIK